MNVIRIRSRRLSWSPFAAFSFSFASSLLHIRVFPFYFYILSASFFSFHFGVVDRLHMIDILLLQLRDCIEFSIWVYFFFQRSRHSTIDECDWEREREWTFVVFRFSIDDFPLSDSECSLSVLSNFLKFKVLSLNANTMKPVRPHNKVIFPFRFVLISDLDLCFSFVWVFFFIGKKNSIYFLARPFLSLRVSTKTKTSTKSTKNI